MTSSKRKILTTKAARTARTLASETLRDHGVDAVIALGKEMKLNFSWCTGCRKKTPDVETVVETTCLVCHSSK